MKYFDSDFLINSLVIQDSKKHIEANDLIESSLSGKTFAISLLSLQEVSFVLSKLNYSKDFINKNLNFYMRSNPFIPDLQNFKRAIELAIHIGFSNINDCIHTAVAESYCQELITFNRKDFNKLKKYSTIKIIIL
jgi:predicted nucleic acid-binding protein